MWSVGPQLINETILVWDHRR